MISSNLINQIHPKFKGYSFIEESFVDFPDETIAKMEHIVDRSHTRLLNASRGCDVFIAGEGDSTIGLSARPIAKSGFHKFKMNLGILKDTYCPFFKKKDSDYFETITDVNKQSTDELEETLLKSMEKVSKAAFNRFGKPLEAKRVI